MQNVQTCSVFERAATEQLFYADGARTRLTFSHFVRFFLFWNSISIVSIKIQNLPWHRCWNFTTFAAILIPICLHTHTNTHTHPIRESSGGESLPIEICCNWINFELVYLTRSRAQMIQLRCLRLTLWWNGEITKVKIRSLCIGTANQLMLFGIQKCERLWARSVCVHTHSALALIFFLRNFVAIDLIFGNLLSIARAHCDDERSHFMSNKNEKKKVLFFPLNFNINKFVYKCVRIVSLFRGRRQFDLALTLYILNCFLFASRVQSNSRYLFRIVIFFSVSIFFFFLHMYQLIQIILMREYNSMAICSAIHTHCIIQLNL